MKKIIASALLMAGLSTSAFAGVPTGEIVLGFKATGGTGSASNLEIDLGSISTFKAVSGTVTLTNLLNTGAFGTNTIDTVFGASWNTRSDVLWGAVGTVFNGTSGPGGEAQRTIWGTRMTNTSLLDGVSTSTSWGNLTFIGSATPVASITPLLSNFGSSPTVGGSLIGSSYLIAANGVGSWSSQETSSASFKAFNPGPFNASNSFENSANISGAFVASDLYELVPGTNGSPSTYLGTLAIWTNGNVTFSTIPEPSTYAAIIGALVLGFVIVRRRQMVAA
jgi:hypothetical protein